jgi:hypothetical protein
MKLRNLIAIIAFGFLLVGAFVGTFGATAPHQSFDAGQTTSTGVPAQDLVFIGTVTRIYPVASPHSRRNWAVVTHFDRVISGELSGTSFTFTAHSPAGMGLRVGRAYTIKATRSEGGYLVDDAQLLKPSPCYQSVVERDALMSEAERDTFTVRRVEFIGLTYTRDQMVRDRMTPLVQEGDLFSRKKLVKSLQSMSRLRASINPLGLRDVVVQLNRSDKSVDMIICFKQKPRSKFGSRAAAS